MNQEVKREPVVPPYGYMAEDEIDLSELFAVLWRRKRVIVFATLLIFALGALYCVIATKKYLISAQIAPGITGYSNGAPTRNLTPKDLQSWFQKKAYLSALEGLLPEDKLKKVKIIASTPRGSNVVSLEFYWPDKSEGREIIAKVIDSLSSQSKARLNKSLRVSESFLKEAIRKKKNALEQIGIQRDELARDIDIAKDNLKLVKDQIKTIDQKIEQTQALVNDMVLEVKGINKNTNDLIKLRNELARNPKADKFSVLMYTNIIQQNMSYTIELRKNITALKKTIFDLELSKKNKENEIKKILDRIKTLEEKKDKELPLKKTAIESEIDSLTSKKEALAPVETVQPPFSSLRPEKPKVPMILAVSLVIGGFLGTLGAFFVEFFEKNRDKIISG